MSKERFAESFTHWIDFKKHRISKLRYSVLKKISKKSLPLFFKGGDIISLEPIANGSYETDIKALIEHFADVGFNDFLLDIGANIGLTSCQSGSKFKEIHMFEPNPNCVSILKINCNIALRSTNYVIHDYGLGSKDEELKLHVPYDNWGGAFVKSSDNDYSESTLSEKDGYGKFDESNYDIVDVQIQSAKKAFEALFAGLINKGQTKGVVKIDAEGYERFIINQMLSEKPKEIQCAVIFENWKDAVDANDYLMGQAQSISLFKLVSNKARFTGMPRWVNSLMNFVRGGFPVVLQKVEGKFSGGTYLLIT